MNRATSFQKFVFAALLVCPLSVGADSIATGGVVSLLQDEPGHSGGRVSGGTYSFETSTGAAVAGGVSNITVSGVQSKDGYTGQLYDPKTLVVSPNFGMTMTEGGAVQLSAVVTMDDGTTVSSRVVDWTVESGPAVVDGDGLVLAEPVTTDATASIRGSRPGISGSIELKIINLPYQTSPLTWTDPTPGGGGPYTVWFGTQPSSLSSIGSSTTRYFNPGQLALGTTYYYQIFDSRNNDVTPGGPGPNSFRTSLYRPDIKIGRKGRLSAQKGNGVYNKSGRGQTIKLDFFGRGSARLYFSVENDGDSIDRQIVRGSTARKKLKSVRYFKLTQGRANVTGSMIRSGYTQPDQSPSGLYQYQVVAKSRKKGRARQFLNISAVSVSDSRAADVARAKLKSFKK